MARVRASTGDGPAASGGAAASRLSRTARRAQLLDTAAEILVERGVGGLTMERLAEQAGVSKALPYLHFENATDVLVALYQREVERIGAAVAGAISRRSGAEARTRAAVRAYFDVVEERGALLSILAAPGSAVPALADTGERLGPKFVAEHVLADFGLSKRRVRVLASVILGTISGAVEAWAYGEASRATAEAIVIDVILYLVGSSDD